MLLLSLLLTSAAQMPVYRWVRVTQKNDQTRNMKLPQKVKKVWNQNVSKWRQMMHNTSKGTFSIDKVLLLLLLELIMSENKYNQLILQHCLNLQRCKLNCSVARSYINRSQAGRHHTRQNILMKEWCNIPPSEVQSLVMCLSKAWVVSFKSSFCDLYFICRSFWGDVKSHCWTESSKKLDMWHLPVQPWCHIPRGPSVLWRPLPCVWNENRNPVVVHMKTQNMTLILQMFSCNWQLTFSPTFAKHFQNPENTPPQMSWQQWSKVLFFTDTVIC